MPVLKQEPLTPTLLASPIALSATDEQIRLIREVLATCCSDSKFAEKAYDAIRLILRGDNTPIPVASSLSPNTVVIGAPSFTLHVIGRNFNPTSKIIFNGFEEPTTFVSSTDVTTGVNMNVWKAPVVVPVAVRSGNVQSFPVLFSFT